MLAGFVAEVLVHPHELEEDAVSIDGGAVETAAIAGPTGPEPILHLIAGADVARGEKLSKACAACHSFDQGGPNKVGPNLWGIVNAAKAHLDSFAYSEAMETFGGSWNYASLNKFLYKPKDYIPGTKMNYVGIKKPEDRAAMVAWLRTLAGSPAALPSEGDIAAEKAELAPEVEAEAVEEAVEEAGP
jgi:cytochrome c